MAESIDQKVARIKQAFRQASHDSINTRIPLLEIDAAFEAVLRTELSAVQAEPEIIERLRSVQAKYKRSLASDIVDMEFSQIIDDIAATTLPSTGIGGEQFVARSFEIGLPTATKEYLAATTTKPVQPATDISSADFMFKGREADFAATEAYLKNKAAPVAQAEPAAVGAVEMNENQIEKGWKDTFSTENPYCPCNLKSFTKVVRWAERAIAQPVQPAQSVDAERLEKYAELIYAVASKWPNETRHETALRYIRKAENQCHGPTDAIASQKGGQS